MRYKILFKYKHEYEDAHAKEYRYLLGIENQGLQRVDCSLQQYEQAQVGFMVELPILPKGPLSVSTVPVACDLTFPP
jgi:hypothetical protein